MADVIGELAALSFVGGESLAAGLAIDDVAEQVGTGGTAGVNLVGAMDPRMAANR